MMDSILVTGGAGFIGSTLTEELLKMGHSVVIIDNFNDYYSPAAKSRNIRDIKERMNELQISQSKLKLYTSDLRDKEFLSTIFHENTFNHIVHLAAIAGVRYSLENPSLYFEVNVCGTLNLLEQAREHAIDRFIFGSSSSVYGSNPKVPFSEDDRVDNPISPYAASKKSGELLCHTYYHLYGISVVCLRFFTVYGPRQRPDLAIHKFVKLIKKNEAITLYGDGSTERDYTYIGDIVSGIVKTMEWLKREHRRYEIFNLGRGQTVSLSEMVETIEEILGKNAVLDRKPVQPGDLTRTCADITKARRELGYFPKTDLKGGIEEFILWLKKQ